MANVKVDDPLATKNAVTGQAVFWTGSAHLRRTTVCKRDKTGPAQSIPALIPINAFCINVTVPQPSLSVTNSTGVAPPNGLYVFWQKLASAPDCFINWGFPTDSKPWTLRTHFFDDDAPFTLQWSFFNQSVVSDVITVGVDLVLGVLSATAHHTFPAGSCDTQLNP